MYISDMDPPQIPIFQTARMHRLAVKQIEELNHSIAVALRFGHERWAWVLLITYPAPVRCHIVAALKPSSLPVASRIQTSVTTQDDAQ
jgi:hypothetical protein